MNQKLYFQCLIILYFLNPIINYAQEHSAYTEPTKIRLLNPEKIYLSVEKTFDDIELIKFQKQKVSLKCYIDSSGQVSKIKVTESKFEFSDLNLELFKLNLKKYLKFEVPLEYKSESMSEYRYFILATNPKMFNQKLK